jgi:DNA-binding NarL/FixJ family response regulator
VLTTYANDTSVLAALRAGARGYLTKDADRADIARALHSAASGLSVVAASVQQTLLARGQRAGTGPARTHAQLPDRLTLGKPKSSPSSQQE